MGDSTSIPEAVLDKSLPELETQGYALLPGIIDPATLQAVSHSLNLLEANPAAAGQRNLLSRSGAILEFALSGVCLHLARAILGPAARPVRGILFDKTPQTNWYVTWHQDLTIPVRSRIETPGFSSWSVKNDIVHVQPPAAVLESMVSLRVHLDPCGEENGPIRFIPGSHDKGVLDAEAIARWKDKNTAVACAANRGDIIAMRPLILHASSVSELPQHRRVLHIEYAGVELPNDLSFAEA